MGKASKWLSRAKKIFLPKRPRDKAYSAHDAPPSRLVPLAPHSSVPSPKHEQQAVEQAATNELDELEELEELDDEEQEEEACVTGAIEFDEPSPGPPPVPAPTPKSVTPEEKTREELAAIKIQTTYRVRLAKRKLQHMLGMSKLQAILHGKAARRQTSNTMRRMQTFTKMQTQVRVQRSRMLELESQKRQELDKDKPESGLSAEDWDDSTLSKEQIKEKLQIKHQAAIKRERTLAYAFSHQLWRSYPKDTTLLEKDGVEKPNWSWSWLEQWMLTRTWESLQDSKSPDLNTPKASFLPALNSQSPTRKQSPAIKAIGNQLPKVSSPVRKANVGQQHSPSHLSRKPALIQPVTKPGIKPPPGPDENQTRTSPRTSHNFVPHTPERDSPAKKSLFVKNGLRSPFAMSPNLHKSPKRLS